DLQRSLDQLVAAGVPGAVLLVRKGDRTIRLTSGYGNLNPKTPMRAGDRFRVGSITKTFVATVALQLVGERKLALEDNVERWLPGVVTWAGAATCTPPATASRVTAVAAAARSWVGLGPVGIFPSSAYSACVGCLGQLNPSPFGMTTSSRCL
ncbi:MAG TPA: serine hydrolase domain-containing protein, partial [Mycobacteriales bacterium]|nr:serine hydrolase domain-containing protein [Mycobacteriales bacterium]